MIVSVNWQLVKITAVSLPDLPPSGQPWLQAGWSQQEK